MDIWKVTFEKNYTVARQIGNGLFDVYRLIEADGTGTYHIAHGICESPDPADTEVFPICRKTFSPNEGMAMIDNLTTQSVIQVETSKGTMFAETVCSGGTYPGIWVYMEDNEAVNNGLTAVIEESSPDERIQVVSYSHGKQDPCGAYDYETGRAILS